MTFNDEPDQEERIAKLRADLEKLGGSAINLMPMPPDMEEECLRQVLEYETTEPISLFTLLENAGIEIPAPDQLDDNALTSKLKEIVDRMASLKAYLINTNHLSDRELYERLYYDSLPNKVRELSIECVYLIECAGIGTYEGTQIFLRYYADVERRREFSREYPNVPIPKRENPPSDRDRFLPQPPEPSGPETPVALRPFGASDAKHGPE
jgi:hypothetical protein